jgi:hypothetical protein
MTTNALAPELLASVRTRLVHVEEQLTQSLPSIATELDYIYSTLKANPSIAYLLEDKEIGVFIAGQRQNLGIVIAANKPTKAKKPATDLLSFL